MVCFLLAATMFDIFDVEIVVWQCLCLASSGRLAAACRRDFLRKTLVVTAENSLQYSDIFY
jgi:hypothetical protein